MCAVVEIADDPISHKRMTVRRSIHLDGWNESRRQSITVPAPLRSREIVFLVHPNHVELVASWTPKAGLSADNLNHIVHWKMIHTGFESVFAGSVALIQSLKAPA